MATKPNMLCYVPKCISLRDIQEKEKESCSINMKFWLYYTHIHINIPMEQDNEFMFKETLFF